MSQLRPFAFAFAFAAVAAGLAPIGCGSSSPSATGVSEAAGTGGSPSVTQTDAGTGADAGPVFPDVPMLTFQSASKALSMTVRTTPVQPPNVGVYCEGQLVVTDASGNPVEGLTIKVTPYMPTMGHPSAVTPSVTEEGNGVYLIHDLALSMPGSWELVLKIGGAMTDSATSPHFTSAVVAQ